MAKKIARPAAPMAAPFKFVDHVSTVTKQVPVKHDEHRVLVPMNKVALALHNMWPTVFPADCTVIVNYTDGAEEDIDGLQALWSRPKT